VAENTRVWKQLIHETWWHGNGVNGENEFKKNIDFIIVYKWLPRLILKQFS
jgi:hypothetical protein